MANLTLSIDDDLLRRARLRALEQDTSVNALVREYLEDFTGARTPGQMHAFLGWAASAKASSGAGGRTWTRDELYER